MLIALRYIDFQMYADASESVDAFLAAMLEQRSLVLHNLSIRHHRMVKFVEVRDFNNVWVATVLAQGSALIKRIKTFAQTVQSHYPEVGRLAAQPNP